MSDTPSDIQIAPHTAAVLIIGAEVLSGKVVDENGPFLIRSLRARGIDLVEMRTIGDDIGAIAEAVNALCRKATYVFTTGGIGPTHDDMTMAGVAAAFGVSLIRDAELSDRLHARYGKQLNPAVLKMAEIPVGSTVEMAEGGFVPTVQLGNVTILPGVPSLMRLCFEKVAGMLNGPAFVTRALFLNISESLIARHLACVQAQHAGVAIGSYPRFDNADYRVKVTVDGRDAQEVSRAFEALRAGLPKGSLVGEN